MSNLKRYYVGPGEFGGCIEEESVDGVWVKFDDIKELLNTAHNSAMVPCKACQPMRKCTHGFAGKCRCVPCMLAQAPVARDVVCN